MQPVLFDSSIYITALRNGDEAALSLRRLAVDSPVWLSAVVPFPGINGLRYGPKTNFVYYTTSSQDLFMRVAELLPGKQCVPSRLGSRPLHSRPPLPRRR